MANLYMATGTAMVYPTLLPAIGDDAHPAWRGSSVGIYRRWRDGGYVVGAVIAGVLADLLGMNWAIGAIGSLTLLSGGIAARLTKETLARTSLAAS